MIKSTNKKTCNESILAALQDAHQNLSQDAVQNILQFLMKGMNPNGGFSDRAGVADPYYSVFGYTLSFVFGLELSVKKEREFLNTWALNRDIDLVHAVSLLQCSLLLSAIEMQQKLGEKGKNALNSGFFEKLVKSKLIRKVKKESHELLQVVESYRSEDGGFNHTQKHAPGGSIYGNFLVWCLYQDLEIDEFDLVGVLKGVNELQLSDGSYVNEKGAESGVTSICSAALIMNQANGGNTNVDTIEWLKDRMFSRGGFVASEQVPIADLLSTATALLALHNADVSLESYANKCLEFINLHWDNSGGFFGSIADMQPDCEYTYYALLALGILL